MRFVWEWLYFAGKCRYRSIHHRNLFIALESQTRWFFFPFISCVFAIISNRLCVDRKLNFKQTNFPWSSPKEELAVLQSFILCKEKKTKFDVWKVFFNDLLRLFAILSFELFRMRNRLWEVFLSLVKQFKFDFFRTLAILINVSIFLFGWNFPI